MKLPKKSRLGITLMCVSIAVLVTIKMLSTSLTAKLTITQRKPVPSPVNKTPAPNVRVAVIPRAFRPAMSEADDAILKNTLRLFAEAVDAANITYFMFFGTLIGSFRHHDRIPWDDDIDIIVSARQKTDLEKALKSLAPDYLYAKSAYTRWKVFASNVRTVNGVAWKFPFLDVSFYSENNDTLWDQDPGYRRAYTFRKSDVFPLCRRPFGGMMLPAPRDTSAVLRRNKLDDCISSDYNHSIEERIPADRQMLIPCSKLWDRLPFVFRTETSHGIKETLKIGSRVISWFMT